MKNLVIVELIVKSSFKSLKNLGERFYLLTLLFLLATISSFGQNTKVIHVNDFLTKKYNTENNSKTTETVSKIKSFLQDLKPSIYVYKQIVNKKSDAPVCLYTDIASVTMLNELDFLPKSIEFVTINVKSKSEVKTPVDLSLFTKYPKLRYILLVFEYNVSQSEAEISVSNAGENQVVLYKVETQS